MQAFQPADLFLISQTANFYESSVRCFKAVLIAAGCSGIWT